MLPDNPLRTLARSNRWLVIYSRAKELNLNLFKNNSDFTPVQIMFLQYLELYHSLYCDLAVGNKEKLTEEVIKNEALCDCYLIYERNKEKEAKENKGNENQTTTTHKPSLRDLKPGLPPKITFTS